MSAIHPHVKPRDGKEPERETASYDDITREVVPLPDSSYRPTTAEVAKAHAPPPEPTELEQVIAAAVRAAFADDGYLDGSDLGVVVEGTTAVLQGSVVTEKDRRRAVEIAEGVPGVTEVRDELRVRL
jgi:hypothetical protein